jgi:uncharacterized protein (TIGR02265 family)
MGGNPSSGAPASGQPPSPWFSDPTLQLAQRISGAPDGGLVKGWLFQSVLEQASASGAVLDTSRRYLGFKDYAVAEYLELLAQAAVRAHPDLPAVETLRLLGRGVYDTFAKSLFAKVIMASLGSGHSGARTGLRWIAHVYKLTSNHAIARFQEVSETVAMIELESVWSFPDSYHVGIFEGAAVGFGGKVTTKVERRSLSSVALTLEWVGNG